MAVKEMFHTSVSRADNPLHRGLHLQTPYRIKEIAGIIQINLLTLEGDFSSGGKQTPWLHSNTELSLSRHSPDTQNLSLVHRKFTFRTVSPGMFTHRFSMKRITVISDSRTHGLTLRVSHHDRPSSGRYGYHHAFCGNRLDDFSITHDHDGVADINNFCRRCVMKIMAIRLR
jgi:hypothetical protein